MIIHILNSWAERFVQRLCEMDVIMVILLIILIS
nr:MAG TPA: hypothetical protein [Caudoviricetes sp.]